MSAPDANDYAFILRAYTPRQIKDAVSYLEPTLCLTGLSTQDVVKALGHRTRPRGAPLFRRLIDKLAIRPLGLPRHNRDKSLEVITPPPHDHVMRRRKAENHGLFCRAIHACPRLQWTPSAGVMRDAKSSCSDFYGPQLKRPIWIEQQHGWRDEHPSHHPRHPPRTARQEISEHIVRSTRSQLQVPQTARPCAMPRMQRYEMMALPSPVSIMGLSRSLLHR